MLKTLKSRSGSTLVLAVVLLGLVLLFGTVMLTLSQVAIKSTAVEQENEQTYFVAKSVLTSVCEELVNKGSQDGKPPKTLEGEEEELPANPAPTPTPEPESNAHKILHGLEKDAYAYKKSLPDDEDQTEHIAYATYTGDGEFPLSASEKATYAISIKLMNAPIVDPDAEDVEVSEPIEGLPEPEYGDVESETEVNGDTTKVTSKQEAQAQFQQERVYLVSVTARYKNESFTMSARIGAENGYIYSSERTQVKETTVKTTVTEQHIQGNNHKDEYDYSDIQPGSVSGALWLNVLPVIGRESNIPDSTALQFNNYINGGDHTITSDALHEYNNKNIYVLGKLTLPNHGSHKGDVVAGSLEGDHIRMDVEGDLIVKSEETLTISGTITGDVYTNGKITLTGSGKITGKIYCKGEVVNSTGNNDAVVHDQITYDGSVKVDHTYFPITAQGYSIPEEFEHRKDKKAEYTVNEATGVLTITESGYIEADDLAGVTSIENKQKGNDNYYLYIKPSAGKDGADITGITSIGVNGHQNNDLYIELADHVNLTLGDAQKDVAATIGNDKAYVYIKGGESNLALDNVNGIYGNIILSQGKFSLTNSPNAKIMGSIYADEVYVDANSTITYTYRSQEANNKDDKLNGNSYTPGTVTVESKQTTTTVVGTEKHSFTSGFAMGSGDDILYYKGQKVPAP